VQGKRKGVGDGVGGERESENNGGGGRKKPEGAVSFTARLIIHADQREETQPRRDGGKGERKKSS